MEELILLIEDTEEAGILDADQADLVQNVFRLSTKRVAEGSYMRTNVGKIEFHRRTLQ